MKKIIIIALLIFSVSNACAISLSKACLGKAEIASQIMIVRQTNPISEQSFRDNAIKAGHMNASLDNIIRRAYAVPVGTTQDEKQEAVNSFTSAIASECEGW